MPVAIFARAFTPGHLRRPCPVVVRPLVRLGGRARCPHRAAAPSARCAAWHRAAWLRAHLSCPVACAHLVRLGGRARCLAAGPPGSRRRAIGAAWQVAHAESFACRGSVRGTVRGRAAHPARCHDRAAIYPRGLRTATGRCGAMGTSPPTAITHAHYPRKIRMRITHGHGTIRRDGRSPGLPARALPPLPTRGVHAMPREKFARALPTATGRCGAMVGRHRTRITHAPSPR